ERVAFPIFGAEDAAEIGVAYEFYPGQVEYFALVPVGRAPDASDARDFGQLARGIVLPARQHDLEHQRVLFGHARQMIDNFQVRLKTGLGGFFRVWLEVIDAADAVEQVELQVWIALQILADLHKT